MTFHPSFGLTGGTKTPNNPMQRRVGGHATWQLETQLPTPADRQALFAEDEDAE